MQGFKCRILLPPHYSRILKALMSRTTGLKQQGINVDLHVLFHPAHFVLVLENKIPSRYIILLESKIRATF